MKLAEWLNVVVLFWCAWTGQFLPRLKKLLWVCLCDSGKAQGGCGSLIHGDTQEHPCLGSILEHHLLAFPPGTPWASAQPKVIFFSSNKRCSCKTEMLLALKLGSTTKTKRFSITFPSSVVHLHSRSGVQSLTPHSPILQNKLLLAWKSRQREALLEQGCRLQFNFACNRQISLVSKNLLLLLSKCLPSSPVRKWSRKYFPEVFLVLLFSYAFCLSVCLCANTS